MDRLWSHACMFSFAAGSEGGFALRPALSKLARFARSLQMATGDGHRRNCFELCFVLSKLSAGQFTQIQLLENFHVY